VLHLFMKLIKKLTTEFSLIFNWWLLCILFRLSSKTARLFKTPRS